MKKTKLDIPTTWPKPWEELGGGYLALFGYKVLVWKRFRRPSKFGIYGFARSHVYQRLWYGRKVLHYRFVFKRMKKAT